MSLRVTDVQAALRHFSNIGHDVTTDPHTVHVDGQPYRMAMGHGLYLSRGSKNPNTTHHSLNSFLMQTERPVITQLSSIMKSENTDSSFDDLMREVTPLVPQTIKTKSGDRHTFYREDDLPTSTVGWHADRAEVPKGITPLWTPDRYFDGMNHKDIHEAIQAHTSPSIAFPGVHHDEENNASHFTQQQSQAFDNKAAMENIHKGLGISKNTFRGLVMVHHYDRDGAKGMYHYDPQTEQLFDHKEGM